MDDEYWDALPPSLVSADLSTMLRISPRGVRQWLKEGRIPGYHIGGSWIVFTSEVHRWLDSTSTVPVESGKEYPDPLDDYPNELTWQDLARLFRKSRPTIYKWLASGIIPAYRPGGAYIVQKSAVRRFLERHSNQRPDYDPERGSRSDAE